jgi:hypothetical protein
MFKTQKLFFFLIAILMSAMLAACPGRNQPDNEAEENYRVGTWAGTVQVTARLVTREEPQYWNAAWKVEADVRLDEFQDGSLKGTSSGNLFCWSNHADTILDYPAITAGHWDQYSIFTIYLSGQVDENGYTLTADALPISLPDPTTNGQIIEFWDFLYPKTLEGLFQLDSPNVIQGDSVAVQGNDYEATRILSSFREFEVKYQWSIRKL